MAVEAIAEPTPAAAEPPALPGFGPVLTNCRMHERRLPVIPDTCVLVPVYLCDTLPRLAERRLYLPRWSSQTGVELERALVHKIGLTPENS